MAQGWPERLWQLFDAVRDKDADTLRVGNMTSFDEVTTAEFTPQIELDSSNGLSALRDVQTVANDGTITATGGEYKLSTSATANGSAELATAERGRYQPGIEAIAGIAMRRPSAPTGNQVWEVGYFDANNGAIVGEDANGLYLRLRVGGSDKAKVRRSDWLDPVDGTGLSGRTWRLDRVTILRFPIVWYGGGPISVEAILSDTDDNADRVVLHRFGPTAGEPIIEQPKQSVRARVDNGGDTSNFDLFVAGRHYSIRGRYNPNRRQTTDFRLEATTGTTLIPLLTFKKKTDNINQPKSVKVSGLNVITDTDSLIEIVLDATLTNASFGSVDGVPDSETAAQVDKSATAISGGQVIDRSMASGGSGRRTEASGIRRLGIDIPDDTNVTLAIRTVSGSGSASAVFSIEEEW